MISEEILFRAAVICFFGLDSFKGKKIDCNVYDIRQTANMLNNLTCAKAISMKLSKGTLLGFKSSEDSFSFKFSTIRILMMN